MGIEDARPRLGDLVDRVRLAGEHFVITRHGKPAAVLVSLDWLEETRAALDQPPGGKDR